MSFQIKKATRQGIIPLIVFYSESGCGKTYSALLAARGIAGPSGKVVVIDTESGRASLYADLPIFGGYETVDFEAPFSPSRYVAALEFAKNSGADVIVLDSGSHEWEGVGGVLDAAAENEDRTKRAGLHNWKEPKFEHAKFVSALIRSTIPVIVCLRAKYKTRQGKDEKGKTQIIKDDFTSPIQAEDFIFEATVHGEILPNHALRLTKWSHPSLKECFPKDAPIELKHGEMVAKWCKAGVAPKAEEAPAQPDIKTAKARLWKLTMQKHNGDAKALEQWLIDEALMDPADSLQSLTAEQIQAVTKKAEAKLK